MHRADLLRAAVGHAGLVAGFNADHCKCGTDDQAADCIVDLVHGLRASETRRALSSVGRQ